MITRALCLCLAVVAALAPLSTAALVPCRNHMYTAYGGSPASNEPVFNVTVVDVDHDNNGTTPMVPETTIVIQLQERALDYFNQTGLHSDPHINYFSMPLPWCRLAVTVTCADRVIYGQNTPDCELEDKDLIFGGGETAGRIYIYPDYGVSCNGTVTVVYLNVSPGFATGGDYTYDWGGVLNGVTLTETAAHTKYTTEDCVADTGGAPIAEHVFCTGPELTCVPLSRAAISTTLSYSPFTSVGVLCGSSEVGEYIWGVQNNEPLLGIDVEYDIQMSTLNSGILTNPSTGQLAVAGHRYQHLSTITTHPHYLYDNARLRATRITPTPASQNSIPPCVCGLSIACDGGNNPDEYPESIIVNLVNFPPVAIVDDDVLPTTLMGTVFNSGANSFDFDAGPVSPLTYHWVQVDGPDTLSIVDASSVNFEATVPGTEGVYIVILWVSDGQDVSGAVFSVVASSEGVVPIIEGPTEVFKDDVVFLDGSQSEDVDEGLPLQFQWVLLSGLPANLTLSPNNTNVNITFVASNITQLVFQLRVNSTGAEPVSAFTTHTVDVNLFIPPVIAPPPYNETIPNNCTNAGGECLTHSTMCTVLPGDIIDEACAEPASLCCVPIIAPSPSPSPTPTPSVSPTPTVPPTGVPPGGEPPSPVPPTAFPPANTPIGIGQYPALTTGELIIVGFVLVAYLAISIFYLLYLNNPVVRQEEATGYKSIY